MTRSFFYNVDLNCSPTVTGKLTVTTHNAQLLKVQHMSAVIKQA